MIGLKTRRGLSAVVTSAMLLTFVAVIGSSLVGWSNSNLKAFEVGLVTTSANMTNQINENLSIENIAFCVSKCGAPKNVINVTLTNTGTLPVRITQIQVNSTAIKSYFGTASLPATISPKQSYLVSAILASPLKSSWASKIPDTITVTTARNSIFTTQGVPP